MHLEQAVRMSCCFSKLNGGQMLRRSSFFHRAVVSTASMVGDFVFLQDSGAVSSIPSILVKERS